MKRKAAFLDRDGVINKEVGHLHRVDDLHLLPGVARAIRRLNDAGYWVVVLTNQGGIAKGLYTIGDMETVHAEMAARLAVEGARIDKIYFCPHHPQGIVEEYAIVCECRKPGVGMIEDAVRELDIELAGSFFAGDKPSDILAGKRMGVRTVLIGSFEGAPDVAEEVIADLSADSLEEAIAYFL